MDLASAFSAASGTQEAMNYHKAMVPDNMYGKYSASLIGGKDGDSVTQTQIFDLFTSPDAIMAMRYYGMVYSIEDHAATFSNPAEQEAYRTKKYAQLDSKFDKTELQRALSSDDGKRIANVVVRASELDSKSAAETIYSFQKAMSSTEVYSSLSSTNRSSLLPASIKDRLLTAQNALQGLPYYNASDLSNEKCRQFLGPMGEQIFKGSSEYVATADVQTDVTIPDTPEPVSEQQEPAAMPSVSLTNTADTPSSEVTPEADSASDLDLAELTPVQKLGLAIQALRETALQQGWHYDGVGHVVNNDHSVVSKAETLSTDRKRAVLDVLSFADAASSADDLDYSASK